MTPTNPIPAPGSEPTDLPWTVSLLAGKTVIRSSFGGIVAELASESIRCQELAHGIVTAVNERAGLVAALLPIFRDHEGQARATNFNRCGCAYCNALRSALSGLPAASNHDEK